MRAPLLQELHLQVLERGTGVCELSPVPQGVQLQTVSHQLLGDGHGGEGQSKLFGQLHKEYRGGLLLIIFVQ